MSFFAVFYDSGKLLYISALQSAFGSHYQRLERDFSRVTVKVAKGPLNSN